MSTKTKKTATPTAKTATSKAAVKTVTTKTKTVATKAKTSTPKAKVTAPKAKVTAPKAKVTAPKAKVTAYKATTVKTATKKVAAPRRNTVAVVQLTTKGRRIKKYNSISDAQRATGVNTGSISKVVRGICKTAGGYAWANC